MLVYCIATPPLMKCAAVPGVEHKRKSDDGNAVGSIDDFLETLNLLKYHSPSFSYHLTKCHLIPNLELMPPVRKELRDLDVEIIDVFGVLCSIVGSDESCKNILEPTKSEPCDVL